jgi:hypothetical protein
VCNKLNSFNKSYVPILGFQDVVVLLLKVGCYYTLLRSARTPGSNVIFVIFLIEVLD